MNRQQRRLRERQTLGPFLATYESIVGEFARLRIPTDSPGFCDHPSFLEAERHNPRLLEYFAAFVAHRPYSGEYLAHAKAVVEHLSALWHKELLGNGRLGACIDMSGILLRALHHEGVWCCGVAGSLTIKFPAGASLPTRYFWSVDHGSFRAGHAWLFAPPYTVVDISVGRQPYDRVEQRLIPDTVLSFGHVPTDVDVRDVVSPSAQAEMRIRGIPDGQHLYACAPCLPGIFSSFPPVAVSGLSGAILKYVPVAVLVPDGSFETMTCMKFDGLTPWELYQSKLAPQLLSRGYSAPPVGKKRD